MDKLLLFGILFVGSCTPANKRVTKVEVQTDWHDHLNSRSIHQSICVQGLINRLDNYGCDKIEVKKYDTKIAIECFREKNIERETFWERHLFVIRHPALTKTKLNFTLYKNPTAICIDHLRAIDAYQLVKPKKEIIKIK